VFGLFLLFGHFIDCPGEMGDLLDADHVQFCPVFDRDIDRRG